MDLLSTVFALALYAGAIVLLVGTAACITRYARTPAPLKIPTTPAPVTRIGVAARLGREVVLFESLFKASLWTWLFGWPFHFGMALAVVAHLRYFTEPVWPAVVWLQPWSPYAGLAMGIGLAGLWLRRRLVPRVRYISAPSDHLMLALLLGIALTGLGMRYLSHVDIVAAKAFALGVVRFDWQTLPAHPLLLIHLALVTVLMLVFPFSKLLHAPGVFFSPTRNQVDNPRERRHITPWAADPAASGPASDPASGPSGTAD